MATLGHKDSGDHLFVSTMCIIMDKYDELELNRRRTFVIRAVKFVLFAELVQLLLFRDKAMAIIEWNVIALPVLVIMPFTGVLVDRLLEMKSSFKERVEL